MCVKCRVILDVVLADHLILIPPLPFWIRRVTSCANARTQRDNECVVAQKAIRPLGFS